MARIHVQQAFPAQNTTTSWTAEAGGNTGTLIAVILDESGSMSSCRDATIQGFNEFVQGQAGDNQSGEAYLSLIKFDAPQITTVYQNVNVKTVAPLSRDSYRPNGGTNLLDAIGGTMNQINSFLQGIPKQERPSVMVVILTDGEENSSREYRSEQLRDMVKAAEKADWIFTFLAANIDSFTVGATFGMNASNSINYDTASIGATMDVLRNTTLNVRTAKAAGVSTEQLYASNSLYSNEDRARTMKGD